MAGVHAALEQHVGGADLETLGACTGEPLAQLAGELEQAVAAGLLERWASWPERFRATGAQATPFLSGLGGGVDKAVRRWVGAGACGVRLTAPTRESGLEWLSSDPALAVWDAVADACTAVEPERTRLGRIRTFKSSRFSSMHSHDRISRRVDHRACLRACAAAMLLAALGGAGFGRARAAPAADAPPPSATRPLEPTGFAARRPVMAAACPHGCPWGELGEFVRAAMAPLGYEVILCTNCNRAEGPRIVAKAAHPPPLRASDRALGDETPVDAPVDFGVTEAGMLAAAYAGRPPYEADGPYRDLRLIALIEDPTYLLVAVKESSGIHDLAEIRAKRLPVRIVAFGAESETVLRAYGLDPRSVRSWGASIAPSPGQDVADFDVLISDVASPANNPESAIWSTASQRFALRFLQLPESLLETLSRMPGVQRVTAQWGLLRGLDRPIRTVGRSGEAVFCRADTPEQGAYDVARAIDAHRATLKWYIRPYSYDPRTVWKDLDVPLSSGAERYYREQGYLR